jgi:tetratricopeptide (TPR) repeat protein
VKGADFSALALFAAHLDAPRAHESVAERYAAGTVDVYSCARLFADEPAFLPTIAKFADWTSRLSPAAASALIERHHPAQRVLLLDLAWRELAAPSSSSSADAAERLLVTTSALIGYLPVSNPAVDAIRSLLAGEEQHRRRLGQTLLSRLRLSIHPLLGEQTGLRDRLVRIAGTDGDPLQRSAAVMLAHLRDHPWTVAQYDLIAEAVAHDEPLRFEAMLALQAEHTDATVPEEVLQQALDHSATSLPEDPSAAFAHSNFAWTVSRTDISRSVALLAAGEWQGGEVKPSVAKALMRGSRDYPPDQVERILGACRDPASDHLYLGLDLEQLESICVEGSGECRSDAAFLFTTEATLGGEHDALNRVIGRVAATDVALAAGMLATAVYLLPSSPVPIVLALSLAGTVAATTSLRAATSADVLGARVALDTVTQADPESVLRLLEGRTATIEESAAALLAALDNDLQWGRRPLDQDAPAEPKGIVASRIAVVAAAFAATRRGMEALIAATTEHLAAEHWAGRRAGAFVLNAVASVSPGLFLQCSEGTELRPALLAIAADVNSWSVRWLVVRLLSQFRWLDQEAIDVITAACRDGAIRDAATVEQCSRFGASPHIDTQAVRSLVMSANDRSILIGITLLAGLAGGGRARRHEAIEILAARAASDDPLLDCASDRDGRTLRETLYVTLSSLIWEIPPAAPPVDAPARPGARPAFSPVEQSLSVPTDLLTDTLGLIRSLSGLDWFTMPSKGFVVDGLKFADIWDDDPEPAELELFALVTETVIQMRVGHLLTEGFSDAMVDEFTPMIESGDHKSGLTWLERHAPEYQATVREEAAKLHAELLERRQELRAALREVVRAEDFSARARSAVARLARAYEDEVFMPSSPVPLDPSEYSRTFREWHAHAVGRRLERMRLWDEAALAYQLAVRELEREGHEDPAVAGIVHHDLGDVALERQRLDEAIAEYEKAVALRGEGDGLGSAGAITSILPLTGALARRNLSESLSRLEAEIARHRGHAAPDDLRRLEYQRPVLLLNAGRAASAEGRPETALELFETVEGALAAIGQAGDRLAYLAANDIAHVHAASGDTERADAAFESALSKAIECCGPESMEAAEAVEILVRMRANHDPAAAKQRLSTELARWRAQEQGSGVLERLELLDLELRIRDAEQLLSSGQLVEGRSVLSAVLADVERAARPETGHGSLAQLRLGDSYRLDEDLEPAIEWYEKSLANMASRGEESSSLAMVGIVGLAEALAQRNRRAGIARVDAELDIRRAAGVNGDVLAPLMQCSVDLRGALGRELLKQQQPAQARRTFTEVLAKLDAAERVAPTAAAMVRCEIGNTHAAEGEVELAVGCYEEALAAGVEAGELGESWAIRTVEALVDALGQRDPAEALARLEAEIAVRREAAIDAAMLARLESGLPMRRRASGLALMAQGRAGEARAAFAAALEEVEASGQAEAMLAHVLRHDVAETLLAEGAAEAAVPLLEQALAGKVALGEMNALGTVATVWLLVQALAFGDIDAALARLTAETKLRRDAGADAKLLEQLESMPAVLRQAAGRRLSAQGSHDEALAALKSTLADLSGSRQDATELTQALRIDIGNVYFARDEDTAIEWYEQAVADGSTLGAAATIVPLRFLVNALARRDIEEALARLDTEIARQRSAGGDPDAVATLEAQRPSAYVYACRRLREAHGLEEALAVLERWQADLEESERTAVFGDHIARHEMGSLYLERGDVERAIDCYEQALAGKVALDETNAEGTIVTLCALTAALARENLETGLDRLEAETAVRRESDIAPRELATLERHREALRRAAADRLADGGDNEDAIASAE